MKPKPSCCLLSQSPFLAFHSSLNLFSLYSVTWLSNRYISRAWEKMECIKCDSIWAVLLSSVWLFCNSMNIGPDRFLCPWDLPGKNIGVGCHFLLQGIVLIQGLNPYLLYLLADSLPLSHLGSSSIWVYKQVITDMQINIK